MRLSGQEQLVPGESILEVRRLASSADFDGIEPQGRNSGAARTPQPRRGSHAEPPRATL